MNLESSWKSVTSYFDELPTWGKAALVGSGSLLIYKLFNQKHTRNTPIKTNWDAGIVYLYQFPRTRFIPNISPYCLKLETWLRIAEIPYKNVPCGIFTRSTEGTLPFVEYNGKEYHDSSFIIRDLTNILEKKSLEEHLSDEQRATGRAFEKMAETSLSQSLLVSRLENIDKIIENLPPHLYGGIWFYLFSGIFKKYFVKAKRNVLFISGLGKHTRQEQIEIGSDDLKAISKYLGAKHYLTGFKPTRIDATLFGVLAQVVYAPYESEHLDLIKTECPNLMEYVERIKNRYWPDWGDATTKFSIDSDWKKRPRRESPKRIAQ
ncbi:unnamed protein product [Auanema sp. JU1783]|nr:unnamed protein product [Auanema sp. JU1783]